MPAVFFASIEWISVTAGLTGLLVSLLSAFFARATARVNEARVKHWEARLEADRARAEFIDATVAAAYLEGLVESREPSRARAIRERETKDEQNAGG